MLDWGFNADSSSILLSKEEWKTLNRKKRNSDILDAMVCCAREEKPIPADWVDELTHHMRMLDAISSELANTVIHEMTENAVAHKPTPAKRIELLACELYNKGWAIAG